MPVSLSARLRSWSRYSGRQWLAAVRLFVTKRLVLSGWYRKGAGPFKVKGIRLFAFRFEQSESFQDDYFEIDGQQIPFTSPMDWQQSGREALTGIRLRSWAWLRTSRLQAVSARTALRDFIASEPNFPYRAEPYELSLRIQHGCWWLWLTGGDDPLIENYIVDAAARLTLLTEDHLSNNHLVENGVALCWAGLLSDDRILRSRGLGILRRAWQLQLLPCGAQVEQSPMYQHILLARCLETIGLMQSHGLEPESEFLKPVAARMAGWLGYLQWRDGSFPVVNDSVERPLPSFPALAETLKQLDIVPAGPETVGPQVRLQNDHFECCFDVSGMEPGHCPGHAHSDALQVLLRVDGHPVLVDPGTSTYTSGPRRHEERSVFRHNTVHAAGEDPAEIIGAFRLGRAPKVNLLKVSENEAVAVLHAHYRHQRTLQLKVHELNLLDEVSDDRPMVATFLVDKFCLPVLMNGRVTTKFVSIQFHGAEGIELTGSTFSTAFGQYRDAVEVKVRFRKRLGSRISLHAPSTD